MDGSSARRAYWGDLRPLLRHPMRPLVDKQLGVPGLLPGLNRGRSLAFGALGERSDDAG